MKKAELEEIAKEAAENVKERYQKDLNNLYHIAFLLVNIDPDDEKTIMPLSIYHNDLIVDKDFFPEGKESDITREVLRVGNRIVDPFIEEIDPHYIKRTFKNQSVGSVFKIDTSIEMPTISERDFVPIKVSNANIKKFFYEYPIKGDEIIAAFYRSRNDDDIRAAAQQYGLTRKLYLSKEKDKNFTRRAIGALKKEGIISEDKKAVVHCIADSIGTVCSIKRNAIYSEAFIYQDDPFMSRIPKGYMEEVLKYDNVLDNIITIRGISETAVYKKSRKESAGGRQGKVIAGIEVKLNNCRYKAHRIIAKVREQIENAFDKHNIQYKID